MKDYSSIVISSSVSLRRNLQGFDFPATLDEKNGVKVLNKIADTLLLNNKDYKIYRIKTLSEIDKNIMLEKGLISEKLIYNEEISAAILSRDEDNSVLVNENDHIVECQKYDGLRLIEAYDKLNEFDNQLISQLDVAYDNFLGFLTSSIDHVGTGLRANVDLFLPGLVITGRIRNAQAEINNFGLDFQLTKTIGTKENDYAFSICNKLTIGKRETEYIVRMTELVIKICEMEIQARGELLEPKNIDDIKDKVFRAWGILTNCYKIDEIEAKNFLAEIKMGIALNFIRFKEINSIENLFCDIMPYSLTKISENKVTSIELDKYRASFLANILKTKRIK